MSSSIGSLGLGGLISGMDTTTIIQKMQSMEQAAIDQQTQKKAAIQAKKDAWGQVKDSLTALRTALDGLRFAGPLQSRTVSTTDDTVATGAATSGTGLGSHALVVSQLAQTEADGGNLLASASTPLGIGTGTLTFNGTNVTLTAQDSLYTLRDKINAANAGVTASVTAVTSGAGGSTTQYQLVLTAQKSGSAGITMSDSNGGALLDALGVTSSGGTVHNYLGGPTGLNKPQDALFSVDSINFVSSSNTAASIPGVTLTLKKIGSNTITIGQDTDQAAANVQSWVDALNSTLSLMSTLTAYNGPDTTAGVLNGDSTARSIQTALRAVLSTQVGSSSNPVSNLGDVGVTTGAYGTSDYGKVLFDKNKFVAALTANETEVGQLFGGIHNTTVVGQSSGWTSAGVPSTSSVQTLQTNFTAATPIDQITLTTPDGATTPTSGLQNFTLSYQDSTGVWKTLSTVTSFTGWSRTFAFDPVTAQAIKVDVSSTYNNTSAQISQLTAYAQNQGAAVSMYRYVDNTLAYNTGPIDTMDSTFDDQMKALDDKIAQMTDRMNTEQANLKNQFDAMEQSLSQLQAQGNQLSAMLGGTTSTK